MTFQAICAAKLTELGDDRFLIEFFDYRSGDSLQEFADKIAESLSVTLDEIPYEGDENIPLNDFGDPVIARQFEWNGVLFKVTWEQDYGCHVVGTHSNRQLLEELRNIFVWGDPKGAQSVSVDETSQPRSWLKRIFGF